MKDTVLNRIRKTALEKPERLFAADAWVELTYKEAWEQISGGAAWLLDRGIRQGDRILVDCTQNVSFLITGLAVQLAGAVFVPLEAGITKERAEEIRLDTDAVLCISGKDEAFGCPLVKPDFEGMVSSEREMPEDRSTAEILYTTGTTGTSKGIEISHANNMALAENIISGTEMKKGNVELIPLALSHSHALRTCYANFSHESSVVITDGVTGILRIYQMIQKYKVSALDLSPSAAAVMLRLTRGRFSEFNGQLEYIELGTAALPEGIKEELKKQFPDVRLYNFYGSTESGRSCVHNFNSSGNLKNCIGFPTVNAHFAVLDEEGNEIVSSEKRTGLLASKGPMNMKGYYRRPDLTEEVMRNGYLCTRDEGYIDETGRVFCIGRKDDVINYKGYKLSPEEIEEAAMKVPGIKDCAAVGMPDAAAGEIPVLFYSSEHPHIEEALEEILGRTLDREHFPKKFLLREEIPRTSNGKIRRGELKKELYPKEIR